MARKRVSTTVDSDLLARARAAHGSGTDASLVEAALVLLLAAHRRAEVDRSYVAAYAQHPVEEPDAWGDLASWGEAVRRHRPTPS